MYTLSWPADTFLFSNVLTAGDRLYAPGPPSWSPDGRWLAYVQAGNARNQIWLHPEDGPSRPAAPLTVLVEATDGTDRRDVGGGPQWSPDGRQIAFVGENKRSSTKRTSIFVLDVTTGHVRQLTDHPGSDRTPRWSPDGKWVAFVVAWEGGGEQVAIVPATGGTPLQCTYDRHAHTDLAWAPDSRSLAFSSQRSDDHLFAAGITIFHLDSGDLQLVDHPAPANERSPRFSPDGKQLAFVSDRDGYDSLWLWGLQSGDLHKVETGPGEVAHPTWSPDASQIAFALTNGIWSRIGSVSLQDGAVTWLSPEVGNGFWPAWSPTGDRLAYVWTDAATPRDVWVAELASGRRQQVTHTAAHSIPPGALVRPQRVSYAGAGELAIDAMLYTPPAGRRSGGGILLVHGGPNWVTRDMYDPFLQYLVTVEGHAILAPNVRGSTGYGRAFMDLNRGDYGGLDQADWVAGVSVLATQGGVDPDRIAIWGRSYGGYATMISLCQYPDTFCCGVAQFGVSDWHSLWDRSIPWVRRLLAHQLGHPVRDRALYVERSPITYVDQIRSPILLLHGDADLGVPTNQSLDLAERLARKGHPHEVQIYPGEGHGFNEPYHVADAASRIAGFFHQYLR